MCHKVIVRDESLEGAVRMQVSTIGFDIAKNVLQVHGIDASEHVVFNSRCGDHKFCPSWQKSRRVASAWKRVRRRTTGRASSRNSVAVRGKVHPQAQRVSAGSSGWPNLTSLVPHDSCAWTERTTIVGPRRRDALKPFSERCVGAKYQGKAHFPAILS